MGIDLGRLEHAAAAASNRRLVLRYFVRDCGADVTVDCNLGKKVFEMRWYRRMMHRASLINDWNYKQALSVLKDFRKSHGPIIERAKCVTHSKVRGSTLVK